jgi:hypothetical protein
MFITRKITGKDILIIAVTFLVGCSHYGLLDKLENPGGPNAGGDLQSPRRIFVTSNPSKGNLGGISGADTKCLTDSNNPLGPGNGNWKAMVVDGSARRACTTDGCSGGLSEQIDWVLKPNTTYARPDGTIIATTNPVGLFTFPLNNAIAQLSGVYAWTGLDSFWQTTTTHCGGWNNDTSQNGAWAEVGVVTSQAIYSNAIVCSNAYRLYCVEQ